jgi:HEAT repeat protein
MPKKTRSSDSVAKGLLSANPERRARAVRRIVAGGYSEADRVEALSNAVRDSDELVRIEAAEALGTLPRRRAWPVLRRVLKDRSPLVRSYVAGAGGEL